jgi:hypothetical protein
VAGGVRQISVPVDEINVPKGHLLEKLQWIAGGVGIVALIGSVLLAASDSTQFFQSYLVAWLFVVSLGLGCLAFVLIQFVTRAGWSVAVRRVAEHGMGTLVLSAILFLPLLAGLEVVYSWLDSEHVAADPILAGKEPYLNSTFFLVRAAVYLVSWTLIGLWFRRTSLRQDEVGGTAITRRLQTASAPALVWFGITITYAAFDWIMSLDPHWYSTIFGVYFFAGCFVSGLAYIIATLLFMQRTQLLTNVVNTEHLHDLGKLLFGFVVFWAYIAFSQFMLIWYANIPEETIWYAHRLQHGWEAISVLLAVGHFVVPFFFLLPRNTKRNRATIFLAAMWILFIHYVDLYWLVMPAFHDGLHFHIQDLLTLITTSCLFVAVVARFSLRSSLIPKHDPRLAESLSFENI